MLLEIKNMIDNSRKQNEFIYEVTNKSISLNEVEKYVKQYPMIEEFVRGYFKGFAQGCKYTTQNQKCNCDSWGSI